jgi:hypothetical protein
MTVFARPARFRPVADSRGLADVRRGSPVWAGSYPPGDGDLISSWHAHDLHQLIDRPSSDAVADSFFGALAHLVDELAEDEHWSASTAQVPSPGLSGRRRANPRPCSGSVSPADGYPASSPNILVAHERVGSQAISLSNVFTARQVLGGARKSFNAER